jgi:hypothetical protein
MNLESSIDLVRRRMLKGQGLQKMARLGSQRRRENLQANSQTSKENTAEPREKKDAKNSEPCRAPRSISIYELVQLSFRVALRPPDRSITVYFSRID